MPHLKFLQLRELAHTLMRGLALGLVFFSAMPVMAANTAGAAKPKVVAVVYDDSQSMSNKDRWIHANYALKILTASLRQDDQLNLVWMSLPASVETYKGRAQFNSAIQSRMDTQTAPSSGTPYQSLVTAVKSLTEGQTSEKMDTKDRWLVVISDGGYNDAPKHDAELEPLINQAKSAGVKTIFLPIDPDADGLRVAKYWKSKGMAEYYPTTSSDVVKNMTAIAKQLNGQSDKGLTVHHQGRQVEITATFPLRGVTVLRQDRSTASIDPTITWGSTTFKKGIDHDFTGNGSARTTLRGRVMHIQHPGQEILPAGQKIVLQFDQDLSSLDNIDFLPDVAGELALSLWENGRALTKAADGQYTICEPSFEVRADLLDNQGKSLLTGRTDLDQFLFKVNTLPTLPVPRPTTPLHLQFQSNTWPTEASLTATLTYPGYLYRQSERFQIRFGGPKCQHAVQLKVESGVDSQSQWRAPVDAIDSVPPVRVGVTVDGKPASAKELKQWLANGNETSQLDIQVQDGALLVQPKNQCCALWWNNPGPGTYPTQLHLKMSDPRYVVSDHAQFTLLIDPPPTTWRKIAWWACPVAIAALILALIWYLVRLARKARFGPDAKIISTEKSKAPGGVNRPRTLILREQCNAVARWLWPSKAEMVRVRGVRFWATRGQDLIVDGADLEIKHKIPGWVFDRSRQEATRAKDKRQDNATLYDNGTMKIDEGPIEVHLHYRA